MNYRHPFVSGASYFFTLVTEQRRPWLADADNVDLLRGAFRAVWVARPFEVAAMVVMPDHLHCIWMLPPGDVDFATRWRLIKTWFTKRCNPQLRPARGSHGRQRSSRRYGNIVIGSIGCATKAILSGMSSTSISTRSSMAWLLRPWLGRTPASGVMSMPGFIRQIGDGGEMDFTGVGAE